MLLFAPGLVRGTCRNTHPSAVVIAASLSLADLTAMRRLWRQNAEPISP